MSKRIVALASSLVLALGLSAFTGSALAGNGHGNGNSADAPGQLKKGTTTTAPTASPKGGADANLAASTAGVKPTSSTAQGKHGTSCSTGGGTGSSATCTSTVATAATAQTAAHPDASKRYGDGRTAAQVANAAGAPSGTTLSGPGNSQPHKVTDCKHKHAVDVHAVKSYSSAVCTSARTSTTVTAGVSATAHITAATAAGTSTTATGATAQTGTVLGATASVSHGKSSPQGGVLGAIQSAATLPFTGFRLWLVVAAALALIALGLTLRRRARVTA
jgi:hypothetical protein